jgi:hypothetical protein
MKRGIERMKIERKCHRCVCARLRLDFCPNRTILDYLGWGLG